MFKILVLITLIVIGYFRVSGLSCSSCGSECASACGTRRFRTCCFNYLRKKRGPEMIEVNLPGNYIEDAEELDTPYPIPDEQDLWWRSTSSKGSFGFEDQ